MTRTISSWLLAAVGGAVLTAILINVGGHELREHRESLARNVEVRPNGIAWTLDSWSYVPPAIQIAEVLNYPLYAGARVLRVWPINTPVFVGGAFLLWFGFTALLSLLRKERRSMVGAAIAGAICIAVAVSSVLISVHFIRAGHQGFVHFWGLIWPLSLLLISWRLFRPHVASVKTN